MTTQYLPFSELAGRLELYERLPVPISQSLKMNIYRGAAANGITIAFGTLGARLLTAVSSNWSGFFAPAGYLDFPLGIARFLSEATQGIGDYVVPLNILSLMIIGVVFWRSHAFKQPIGEAFHWLVGVAMIPAAVGIFAAALIATAFVANIVVTIAIWVVLIIVIFLIVVATIFLLGMVLAAISE